MQAEYGALVNGLKLPWSTGQWTARDPCRAAEAPGIRAGIHSVATPTHDQRGLMDCGHSRSTDDATASPESWEGRFLDLALTGWFVTKECQLVPRLSSN